MDGFLKKIISTGWIILFSSSVWVSFLWPSSAWANADEIRVRIFKSSKPVTIKGFNIQFGKASGKRKAKPYGAEKYSIRTLQKNSDDKIWQVIGENGDLLEFSDDQLKVKGEFLRKGFKKLPNEFSLIRTSPLLVSAIATLDLEKYLEGVLPSEMPASWPLEVLKAQAVASRSYTLHMLEKRKSNYFQLDSNIYDQVFKVYENTDLNRHYKNKVKKAIEQTRGLVLFNKAQKVAAGYYHADCGGQTEEPYNVWSGSNANGTVKDASCPISPNSRWNYRISGNVLTGRLVSEQLLKHGGYIKDIHINKLSGSKRILEMDLISSKGEKVQLSAQKLRSLIGFTKIKSAMFKIIKKKDNFLFFGQGHGHGVGLCQWGARFLAKRGLKFSEILSHYYPGKSLNTHLK